MSNELSFPTLFHALTGDSPFPWQQRLYDCLLKGEIPSACDIPTGLGKTAIIPIWLIALANRGRDVPRRLVYVVNRRTVVDQATAEAVKLRRKLAEPESEAALGQLVASLGGRTDDPHSNLLAISTLRGQFADNREWSADPSRPAIIVGTVDMIGSRLLFGGYGVGFKTKPLHAGFLGQDALLVHDEAHLEPAFQTLIEAIRAEQEREPAPLGEGRRLKVMALTATPRGGDALRLAEEDREHPVVKQRIEAKKAIHLHEYDDEKKLQELQKRLSEAALSHRDSNRTVLVFARTVEVVEWVVEMLGKEKQKSVRSLTGTLRGKERDALVEDPVFRRFLRAAEAGEETAYLICTSAGEVGINISADHLICDLSTFESMAQRFGRVNRFGEREDTRIDVFYPNDFDRGDEIDVRRARTLELLRKLAGDGSPAALSDLDLDARRAAFSPDPVLLSTSDILFDAWALTSVRGALPGRPPVEPYLHGLVDREPPTTSVAWREEVGVIGPELHDRYEPKGLLEAYPLKPQELLRDRSSRVFKQIAEIAKRRPDAWAWLVAGDGSVTPLKLRELADNDNKDRINGRTVLLPPSVGGLKDGFLRGNSETPADDVADDWVDEQKARRRERRWDEESPPRGMRLILAIDSRPDAEEREAEEPGDEGEGPSRRFWRWYVRPRSSDDDLSKTAQGAVSCEVHTNDVIERATQIVQRLGLPGGMPEALILAARLHDLGKRRTPWQRSIGNHDPNRCLAKSGANRSGRAPGPIDFGSHYRHEFGSLLDAEGRSDLQALGDELRELALHVIAAHHGRGRPHFEPDEAFDPEHPQVVADRVAAEVPRRFARLQRKFGRWGLAYLESLLRAADYAASAEPSETLDEEPR